MNKLFRYLRPIWWLIVIDVILLGLQSFFALLIPKLMTNITAIMEYPQNYLSQMNGLIDLWNVHWITPSGNAMQDTWIIGGFMMTFALGFLLCAFATSLITSHIGAFYGKGVRHDLFKKVTSMSVGEYHDFGTASLITRTTNDIEQTQLSIQMGLRIMIMSPVSLVIAIIFICTSDPMLGLIVACVIPVLILVAVVLLVKATPLFKKLQDFMDKLTSVLRESLKGVRVIRAFNQEDKEFGRFEKANKDLIDVGVRVDRIMSFGSPIIGICFDATYIAIYVYGFARYDGAKVADGAINFTTIITSAEYAMQLVQSFLMFMEMGTHNELLAKQGFYADLYNSQFLGKQDGITTD